MMSDLNQRFFLQLIDAEYGCVVLEAMFIVSDLSELRGLLGSCADEDPELRWTYWLTDGDLTALQERYGVAFQSDGREVRLDRWHSIREAPYLIHTGYELVLLLDGIKKFARMSVEYPPTQHEYEGLFDRHVTNEVLYKEVELCPFPVPFATEDGQLIEGIRHVYYTLKDDKWRIAAWKMVWEASRKTGWNVTYERLEGMLFGYREWQIDWWTAQWRLPPNDIPDPHSGVNHEGGP